MLKMLILKNIFWRMPKTCSLSCLECGVVLRGVSNCCIELLCTYPFIKFVKDLLKSLCNNPLFPPHKVYRVVINNLMDSAHEQLKKIQLLLTEFITGILASCTLYRIQVFCLFAYLFVCCFFVSEARRPIPSPSIKHLVARSPKICSRLYPVSLVRQMYPGNMEIFLNLVAMACTRNLERK